MAAVCGLWKHVEMAFFNLEGRHGLLFSYVCFLFRAGIATAAVLQFLQPEGEQMIVSPSPLEAVTEVGLGAIVQKRGLGPLSLNNLAPATQSQCC